MSTVIKVENLSKFYKLGLIGGGTLHGDLNRWWARLRGKPDPLLKIGEANHGNRSGEYLWALRDVSFEVQQGEVVGIIGKNGAGKSTLLKIISQITAPTSGYIKIKGRIGSLLEVGTGFHPELTGSENIYLNGAILGMTKSEVTRKFDEIVDFSGVEQFIDTPVKRYSSGMKVRLAFAVAAHLDPEILVIDEVLAVGDTEFQKKCIGKMGDIAGEGRTVLFVTHNMSALSSLCPRSVLLTNGILQNDGKTDAIIQEYLSINSTFDSIELGEKIYQNQHSDDGQFVLHAIRTFDADGNIRDEYKNTEPIFIELEFSILSKIKNLVVGIDLKREFGELVFRSFHNDVEEVINKETLGESRFKLKVIIPSGLLNGGAYYIYPCAGIHRIKWLVGGIIDIEGLVIRISFNVPNPDLVFNDQKPGIVSPLLDWINEK